MYIEKDKGSGFCFGVVNAIGKAEEALGVGCSVCSLGDIVHNRLEVQRLSSLGLGVMDHSQIDGFAGRLLIRAHGEPPATYRKAQACGVELIDATCPVVARLQRIVVEAHHKMQAVGGRVVILGKIGHAEVVGLEGQVDGDVDVVETLADLDSLDFTRPIYLLSQTTQSLSLFRSMGEIILSRAQDRGQITIHDTICRSVANREEHLREFASRFDVIIFVSGRKSSNGKVLFEVCCGANERCYSVEEPLELDAMWFCGAQSVGVCGATSTPEWLMRDVAQSIERLTK